MSKSEASWTNDDELDLDSAPDEYVPPPPVEGVVCATVKKAEPRETKKGDPSVSLTLSVTSMFQGDDLEKAVTAYDNSIVIVPGDGLFRLKQLCAASGVTAPKRNNKEAIAEFCAELTGQAVIFRARVVEYPKGSGRTKTEVERYLTEEQAAEALDAQGNEDELPRRARRTA